ncbi:MAG: response regulator transcription factor [Sporichthyaceae bacterium]
MPAVLIIEDDAAIRGLLADALRGRSFAVTAAETGMSGLSMAMEDGPDIVVLDLGLPDVDGLQVLSMLRAVSSVPVIVATARDDDATVIGALDAGADDYVVKPFSASQLEARIKAVLRRAGPEPDRSHVVRIGALVLDLRARSAEMDGRNLDLSRREFELLAYLADRPGQVVGKRELLVEVWRQPYRAADKTIDVHLSWLRRKLGEAANAPVYLHTVRGVGVKLLAPEQE